MKAPPWKVEGIASGTRDALEHLGLQLETAKGSQCTINNMSLQNMIQLSCVHPEPWLALVFPLSGKPDTS